jgi:hypothetical protein
MADFKNRRCARLRGTAVSLSARGFDEGDDNDGFSTALIELATADPSGCKKALLALAEAEIASLRENAVWLLQFCEPGSTLR